MTRSIRRFFLFAIVILATPAPAWAQVHLSVIGGFTKAASQQRFFAGGLGVKIAFLEIDGEVGKMKDILPRGVLDQLNALQRQQGLPVQAIASVPAWYGLVSARLISPGGPVKPFVAAGLGVARLEPRINVVVQGISLGDVFGLTSFSTQKKTMATLGAGLRFDFGKVMIEGAYRYIVIFTDYRPNPSVNDKVLTNLQSVHAALGIRF